MRYLTLAVLVFLVSAPAVLGCSCSAGDGGCSASSGTCPGGCYAICGAGGCSSGCAGRPQVNTPVFSFSGEGLQAPELQQRISEELGVQFVFAARKVDDHITVDLHDVSAADPRGGGISQSSLRSFQGCPPLCCRPTQGSHSTQQEFPLSTEWRGGQGVRIRRADS